MEHTRLTAAEIQGLKDVREWGCPVKDWDLYPGRTNRAKAKRTTLRRLAEKGFLIQERDEEYYQNKYAFNGARYIYSLNDAGRAAWAGYTAMCAKGQEHKHR